jgi:hypothetical protein
VPLKFDKFFYFYALFFQKLLSESGFSELKNLQDTREQDNGGKCLEWDIVFLFFIDNQLFVFSRYDPMLPHYCRIMTLSFACLCP